MVGGKMVNENQQPIIPQSPQFFNQPIPEQPKPKNKLWIIILIIFLILISVGLIYYFNKMKNSEVTSTTPSVELPAGQIRISSELQGTNIYCQSIENNICTINLTKLSQYCEQNPGNMDCINSSYCAQNPNTENCKKLNICLDNASDKACQTDFMKAKIKAEQKRIDAQMKATMSAFVADGVVCRDSGGNIQTNGLSTGETIAGTNLCSKTTEVSIVWPKTPTEFSNRVYLSNGDKDDWTITTKLLSNKSFECNSSGCSEK